MIRISMIIYFMLTMVYDQAMHDNIFHAYYGLWSEHAWWYISCLLWCMIRTCMIIYVMLTMVYDQAMHDNICNAYYGVWSGHAWWYISCLLSYMIRTCMLLYLMFTMVTMRDNIFQKWWKWLNIIFDTLGTFYFLAQTVTLSF